MAEKARVLALVDAEADKADLRAGLALFESISEDQYQLLNSIESIRIFIKHAKAGGDKAAKKEGKKDEKAKDKEAKHDAKEAKHDAKDKEKADKAADKAAQPPKENATTKACKKEGGKKGSGLADLNGMGGTSYFTVNVEEPKEWKYFDQCFEAMNAEPDADAAEERKGGAGGLAKLVIGGSADLLLVLCHNPKELGEAKGITTREWVDTVLKDINGWEELITTEDKITGQIKANPDKEVFPVKIRDQITAASFQFLRSKKVIPDVTDDDDDWVPDEDAMAESGIGSW